MHLTGALDVETPGGQVLSMKNQWLKNAVAKNGLCVCFTYGEALKIYRAFSYNKYISKHSKKKSDKDKQYSDCTKANVRVSMPFLYYS